MNNKKLKLLISIVFIIMFVLYGCTSAGNPAINEDESSPLYEAIRINQEAGIGDVYAMSLNSNNQLAISQYDSAGNPVKELMDYRKLSAISIVYDMMIDSEEQVDILAESGDKPVLFKYVRDEDKSYDIHDYYEYIINGFRQGEKLYAMPVNYYFYAYTWLRLNRYFGETI